MITVRPSVFWLSWLKSICPKGQFRIAGCPVKLEVNDYQIQVLDARAIKAHEELWRKLKI